MKNLASSYPISIVYESEIVIRNSTACLTTENTNIVELPLVEKYTSPL